MPPLVVEIMVVALTAASFWILDRYVVGCERL